MIEWMWDVAAQVQATVDAGRAHAPSPLVTIPAAMLAAFGVLWWLQTGSRRDGALPGHHFEGRLTPKTLTRMMVNNRVRKPKSRAEHQAALRGVKRRPNRES
ncbi:MAG: hypothetical protein AAGI50_01210 [Pseudomonadota bacterium]